jgi:hypothetical protein
MEVVMIVVVVAVVSLEVFNLQVVTLAPNPASRQEPLPFTPPSSHYTSLGFMLMLSSNSSPVFAVVCQKVYVSKF